MTAGDDGRSSGERGEPFGEPLDEEEALRRLMRDVVSDIEPGSRSLDHIRRAVPMRRVRRKQALLGAVTAVLAILTMPVLMQAGVVSGPLGPDEQGSAAHSEQTGGSGERSGESGERSGGSGGADEGGKASKGDGSESEGGRGRGKGRDRSGAASVSPSVSGSGSAESPGGSEGLSSTSPRCSHDQLGNAAAQLGTPDDQGKIYGSFRLANISGDTCRVKGTDMLVAVARGKAKSGAVQVLDHTEGDKADQLPSPGEVRDDLILRSGEAYQVRFAWVPDSERGPGGCPLPEPESKPEPDRRPDNSGDDPGGSGGDPGGSTGDGNEPNDVSTLGDSGDRRNGGGSESGVTLRYTPAVGDSRSSQVFLNGVCSGTVYRTGPLPAA
jgi:hypothetical protein